MNLPLWNKKKILIFFFFERVIEITAYYYYFFCPYFFLAPEFPVSPSQKYGLFFLPPSLFRNRMWIKLALYPHITAKTKNLWQSEFFGEKKKKETPVLLVIFSTVLFFFSLAIINLISGGIFIYRLMLKILFFFFIGIFSDLKVTLKYKYFMLAKSLCVFSIYYIYMIIKHINIFKGIQIVIPKLSIITLI